MKITRNILIILLVFLGISAMGGGSLFIIAPSGTLFGMNPYLLKDSPFQSFLVPGIILFSILGLAPLLLIYALVHKPEFKLAERINFFRDMHWAWSFSLYIAFALIIWIQLEMVFLRAVHWLHTFYMFYAVTIIFVCLLPTLRSCYKK